jgi:hypothetical protein
VPTASRNENPFPDLVEVTAALVSTEEAAGTYELLIQLRVHPCEIEEEIGRISVEIFEATLSLDIDGVNIVQKTKFGQPVLAAVVHRDVQLEETTNISTDNESSKAFKGFGSAAVSIYGPKLEGKTEGKQEAKEKSSSGTTVKKSTTEELEFYRIKAIGNDNWKLSMEAKKPLDGVFIDNEPLCRLSAIAGSNRIYAGTELVVKQRHMKTELIAPKKINIFFRTNNQEKIAEIVMKKSIHGTLSPDKRFDGSLIFARTESSIEE